jgi:hypothetical protein
MTWAVIGAAAAGAIGTMGASGISGAMNKPQAQPGMVAPVAEKPPVPYQPTAAALPPVMPGQVPGQAPQLPQALDMEQLKKLYGF